MDEKEMENEISKIINESKCVDEAIKFSNVNNENSGAYLAFISGAHFILKHVKKNEHERR